MPRDTEADDKILEEACERFEQIISDDQENRDNYKSDLNFVYSPGSQWPQDVRSQRKLNGDTTCLEFNQLKPFTSQVVNDQLQERPGIRVHAAGGDASEDVAEIEQGMIRAIEYESKADDVYKNAFKLAVVGGRGWCRVVSEYESNEGFNQRLAIKPIQDSNTVYASNDYQMPDGSDRPYLFVTETLSKVDFTAKYPKAEAVSWDSVPVGWGSKDDLVIADYYRRVCTKRTYVQMTDGAMGWEDEMPPKEAWPEGVSIKREREVEVWSVKWLTIAGGEQILEEHDWPGTIIPVVCCAGEDIILEGKRVFQGLIRHARDAQAALNYGMTMQAMQLALAPRAPWVMAEGQNEGYEQLWRDANTKNFSTLIYKPTTIDGVAVPPPQRTQPAMISEGFDRWCQMMLSMIKSTIGIYENSLGQKSQETSRVAIVAKEKQGDTATYNYVNNWHMMIDLIGRICVEVMPTFYDTERIVSIIGIDDIKEMVTINQSTPNPDNPLQAIKNNDITKGKYAVTVEEGPSFATKREETAERLSEMVRAYPPLMQIAGDLVMKAQQIPDADAFVERLHLSLPPAILQAEEAKKQNKQPPDPKLMAQLQEQQQHLDQAAQTMDAMHQEIESLKTGEQSKMAKVQADAANAAADQDLKRRQMETDDSLAREKLAKEDALKREQIDAENALTLYKIDKDAESKEYAANKSAQTAERTAAMQPKPEPKEEKDDGVSKTLEQLSKGIEAIQVHITAPRKLIKGKDGRSTGIDIGGVVRPIQRGSDGSVSY